MRKLRGPVKRFSDSLSPQQSACFEHCGHQNKEMEIKTCLNIPHSKDVTECSWNFIMVKTNVNN